MGFGDRWLEERRVVYDVAHTFCADSNLWFALIESWGGDIEELKGFLQRKDTHYTLLAACSCLALRSSAPSLPFLVPARSFRSCCAASRRACSFIHHTLQFKFTTSIQVTNTATVNGTLTIQNTSKPLTSILFLPSFQSKKGVLKILATAVAGRKTMVRTEMDFMADASRIEASAMFLEEAASSVERRPSSRAMKWNSWMKLDRCCEPEASDIGEPGKKKKVKNGRNGTCLPFETS